MKLTEKDLQDACAFIVDTISKDRFGGDYVEKGLSFDLQRTPITVREIVDTFLVWLKIRIKSEKGG